MRVMYESDYLTEEHPAASDAERSKFTTIVYSPRPRKRFEA